MRLFNIILLGNYRVLFNIILLDIMKANSIIAAKVSDNTHSSHHSYPKWCLQFMPIICFIFLFGFTFS